MLGWAPVSGEVLCHISRCLAQSALSSFWALFLLTFSSPSGQLTMAPPQSAGTGCLAIVGIAVLSLSCLVGEALRPQVTLRLCSLLLRPEESPASSLAPWDLAPGSH